MSLEARVYVLRVISPVVAPVLPWCTVERLKSELPYDQETLEHIDRVFERTVNPLTGQKCVWVKGYAIRSALKEALGVKGKPVRGLRIIGAYFPLDAVSVEVSHVTQASGRGTPVLYEVIKAGATGTVIAIDSVEDFLTQHGARLPFTFQLGAWKSKGFGLVVLDKA